MFPPILVHATHVQDLVLPPNQTSNGLILDLALKAGMWPMAQAVTIAGATVWHRQRGECEPPHLTTLHW